MVSTKYSELMASGEEIRVSEVNFKGKGFVGDPNLNLHLPLESWEGGQPRYNYYYFMIPGTTDTLRSNTNEPQMLGVKGALCKPSLEGEVPFQAAAFLNDD